MFWDVQIPAPVALAAVAVLGYLISRWNRRSTSDLATRMRRDWKRARSVAVELDKIAWTIRQNLAKHQTSVARFKDRVGRLSDEQQDAAWKELSGEVEDMLKPTLQLAAQIAHAYDEIRQQSANLMTFTEVRIDPLTGVHNRRGLDDAIDRQLAMLARYHCDFSVVIFDIDHFKQVNDKEGHLHGDRVLLELARLFDESVRDTDVVARYGGEEFVVVMPETDLVGASMFSERLRAQVETRLEVTISGGVTLAREGDTRDALIARADAALYAAKTAGRNRVFCHTGDGTEPVSAETIIPANVGA